MKRIRTTIRWIVWTIISLYIVTIVLLHIPAVQGGIGAKIADLASEKLGTEVRIGHVDLGFLNRVIIDDLLIYDQHHKKMLSASRIGAKVDLIPLLQSGAINISSAQLFGLKADLYKTTKDSKPNYQFVLDSLASKDQSNKKPLHLSINSLVIRNGSIRYNQYDAPQTPHRFNLHHLDITNISTHIVLDKLDDNSVIANLRSFSCKESAGLDVQQLTFEVNANQRQASLTAFNLQLPNSKVALEEIKAHYELKDKRLINNSLRFDIKGFNSTLQPSDLSTFLPDLHLLRNPYRIVLSARGTNRSVAIRQLTVSSPTESTLLKARGWIKDYDTKPSWNITFAPLKIGHNTLINLAKVAKKPLPAPINNLGNIYYKGVISQQNNTYTARGDLNTNAGSARLAASMHGKNLRGTVITPGFNIGELLANPDFGKVVAKIAVDGSTDLTRISAKGDVFSFFYKGYTYKNIHVDGLLQHDAFNGEIAINDPNGKLEVSGKASNISAFINKKGVLSANININADNVNLHKLQLSDALGDRDISFNSQINGHYSSVDNLNGTLQVSSFFMKGEGQDINIDHLNAKASSGVLMKSLDVTSELGEIHLNGQYTYSSLPQSITNILSHYLPSVIRQKPSYQLTRSKNNYVFSFRMDDTKLLNTLFKTSLTSHYPISIAGKVNDQAHTITMDASAPSLTYDGHKLRHVSLSVDTHPEGLLVNLFGERAGAQGPHVIVKAKGSIANDKVASDIAFQMPGSTVLHGNINTLAAFSHHHGALQTDLHFNPSKITVDTITLQLQPSDLSYYHNNLAIDHFEISNRNQHIVVNGQTSGNPEDSLMVTLKDIDVPYILDIVNFHSVDFSGIASGTASIHSVFSHPQANATLTVRDFTFQEGDMGTLQAKVNYKEQEGKINIDAKADAGADSYTDIKGYVDIKNSYINLPIYAHGTHLYFLKSFCGSFMSDINAQAEGWCKVVGPLDDINLEGDMIANGPIHIKPIGVTYTLKDCRVRLIPNEITFATDTVYDPKGNIGIVTGGLHHKSLTHLTYDINVEAHNLLSYYFPRHTSKETFWGVVYGTGNCDIKGGPGETTMNVELEPEKNTFITYNAATAGDVGTNNFIHWISTPVDSNTVLIPETGNPSSVTAPATTHAPSDANDNNSFADIPSNLHINFLLKTNPNLTLGVLLDEATGDNITLNGSGILRATYYNKGAFQLFGNYNVDHGLYSLTIQNIIKKQFSFQPGSTIAFGGDPFNAALNLKGIYTINSVPLSDLGLGNSFAHNNTKVNCLLNIEGTPAAPTVSFDLDLPTLSSDAQQMVRSILNSEQEMNNQVLYLLAVGRFYPQSNNNNNMAQKDLGPSQTSLAMQSLLSGTISQQINTVLSNLVNNRNWNFGANIATGNEGFSNAEYEGLLSGSMLNNRLLFNGQFGYRDNVAKNSSSFIGDFDIRYLLFPSGNVAFRVYNQTNDRYFSRNSLTTQGVGIILKKDFNHIWDIFGVKRRKVKKDPQKH